MEAIWKTGITEKPKGGPTGGLTAPPWTLSCKGQHAATRCVMASGHKTQSFMKNGGLQK